VSPEKQERRRQFAKQIQLHQYFPPGQASNEAFQADLIEGYAKGGPLWLHIGNPKLVYSMPMAHRQAMAADLFEENPRLAYEFSRDTCRDEGNGEDSLGSYEDYIHSIADNGGPAYKGRGEG
jgi:hypothetical protein